MKSSQTRKGKNRAAHALRLAAWSLIKSKSGLGFELVPKKKEPEAEAHAGEAAPNEPPKPEPK